METNLKPGDTVELTITSLGSGGEGVGKYQGMAFFVPRGLPGDKLLVTTRKVKKRYGSGELSKVLKPSSHRRETHCATFEAGCGGCQWLHLDYQEQLRQKTNTLRETIKRIGKMSVPVDSILPAAHMRHYRNKFSMRVDAKGTIGLNRENSHEVLDLDGCMMETRENVQVYTRLKGLKIPRKTNQIHLRSSPDGRVAVCVFADEYSDGYVRLEKELRWGCPMLAGFDVKTRKRHHHVGGAKFLSIRVGEIEYELPSGSFFQTNYQQAAVLLDQVASAVGPTASDTLLDLYCGVGFFALPLAKGCKSVFGIEFDRVSVKAAESAAARNGIANARFASGDVRGQLSRLSAGDFSIIVLDPPRAGCHPAVLKELGRLAPEKIIYVSCAPDTLARDLGILSEYGYDAKRLRPIDMFPQTHHMEVVSTLERR
jgi:23S rRNA (uracil1939-C5)-methyltransferase